MEQLFGFVIFALLAIFSVASKVREQRKEEERRAQKARERKDERLDLPEATRRTLYGEPGIPTARPREAPPPVAYPMREVREQPRSARPVEAERPDARHAPAERQRHVPTEAPHGPGQTTPPAAQPQAGRKPSSLEELFREMQRRVEQQMGVPQPQPQPQPQPPPQQQHRPRPPQQKRTPQHSTQSYEQARKQQQAARAQAMQRQHGPRPEAPQHARRGGSQPAKQAPATAATAPRPHKQRPRRQAAAMLFRDLDDVRRGIILSEILGTPRSLQPWP